MSSPYAAIDLLEFEARRTAPAGAGIADDVRSAAALLRTAVSDLESTQSALAEALIASQDRLLAVKALVQVDLRGAASEATLDVLLDQALALTGASQVLLLEGGHVSATRGDPATVDRHAALVREVIARADPGVVVTAASDRAMVGALDPEAREERHVAFFRPADRPFSTADIPLVEAISSALGVRLALARLHRRELEQAVIEREHQLASALAQSVIETEPPRSTSIGMFARTVPASLTGGDFYVFGRSGASIWFAVGDVAGKGLPAAMLMTRAVAACRVAFLAAPHQPVAGAFASIEDELFDHLDDAGLFTTLVVGVVDEPSGEVSLVNAGHSPVVLVRDGAAARVRSSVPPLGIVRRRVPAVETFTLHGADRLFLGSDGLVDQCDPQGEHFGYDRFDDLCRASHSLPPSEIGDTVFGALSRFASGSAASDDATLVVIAGSGGAA